MLDRTTKLLLFAVALALWGLLLRPLVTPTAVHGAAEDARLQVIDHQGTTTAFVLLRGRLYVYGMRPNTAPGGPALKFWTSRLVDTKP
jgi:hypothetical protein